MTFFKQMLNIQNIGYLPFSPDIAYMEHIISKQIKNTKLCHVFNKIYLQILYNVSFTIEFGTTA